MLDIYYDLPDWMKDLIDNSIEMQSVDWDKFAAGSKPNDSGGLSDSTKDNDDDEENIPF